jgi:hypothetical protein
MAAMLALALLIAQPALKETDPFIANAIKPDAADSPLRKLQKERCRERAIALATIKRVIEAGNYSPSYYHDYAALQMTFWQNLAELMDKPADRVKCYELRVDAAKELERFTSVRVEAGNDPPQALPIARANRLDAEIDLIKLKERLEKAGKK